MKEKIIPTDYSKWVNFNSFIKVSENGVSPKTIQQIVNGVTWG